MRTAPLMSMSYAGFFALAIFFVAISLKVLVDTANYANLLVSADTILPEDSNNRLQIGQLASESERIISDGLCRSDLLEVGLVFVMRDLDLQDVALRYEDWSQSLLRADRYVQ